jgi:hypothetical protein
METEEKNKTVLIPLQGEKYYSNRSILFPNKLFGCQLRVEIIYLKVKEPIGRESISIVIIVRAYELTSSFVEC